MVDGEPLMLEGLRSALGCDPRVEVVGAAGSAAEAIDIAAREVPDVAIVDILLPDGNGLELLLQLQAASPLTDYLVLTEADDPHTVRGALGHGARGYLLKGATCGDVRQAVARVAAGHSHIDPAVSEYLLSNGRRRNAQALTLTAREIDVLALVSQGLTNEAIGSQLGLGVETVKTHLSRAFERLGARDRASAVAIAIRRGLI